MFWGMTLEPGKLYTEVMGEEVQLSMAAIDSRKELGESPSTNFCQIVIQTEKGEYVLCTLVHGVMFQQSLDLKLMPREKVTFSVQGPSVVYLVGYTASYPEDEEEMRMQQEEYEEDSSAWETFEEGEQMVAQIKQEPVEILDDSDTDVETDSKSDIQGQIPADSKETMATGQPEGATAGDAPKESGDEMIFSVAEIDQPVVKTEPPDLGPPMVPGVMPPSQQQLPPQEELYGSQPSDDEINLQHTSTSQDFFYPDAQQPQQPNIQLNAPMPFQPINSGPDFQQHQGGVLPPAETFLRTPQKSPMQRSHAGPVRQSSSPRQPAQRTYPSPRRQYGTNRSQPAGKTRSAPSQPMNVQQMRNVGGIPQQQPQSMPGPSQMDLPGPSNSGSWLMSAASPLVPFPETGGGNFSNATPVPGLGAPSPSRSPRGSKQGSPARARRGGTCSTTQGQPSHEGAKGADPSFEIVCKICSKRFINLQKFRLHENYHSKGSRYPCTFCEKAFYLKADRVRHERVHTGERPFKCQHCNKTFTRKSHCRDHEATHFKTIFTP